MNTQGTSACTLWQATSSHVTQIPFFFLSESSGFNFNCTSCTISRRALKFLSVPARNAASAHRLPRHYNDVSYKPASCSLQAWKLMPKLRGLPQGQGWVAAAQQTAGNGRGRITSYKGQVSSMEERMGDADTKGQHMRTAGQPECN